MQIIAQFPLAEGLLHIGHTEAITTSDCNWDAEFLLTATPLNKKWSHLPTQPQRIVKGHMCNLVLPRVGATMGIARISMFLQKTVLGRASYPFKDLHSQYIWKLGMSLAYNDPAIELFVLADKKDLQQLRHCKVDWTFQNMVQHYSMVRCSTEGKLFSPKRKNENHLCLTFLNRLNQPKMEGTVSSAHRPCRTTKSAM